MSAILLKEETYKKLKHDANIKVFGDAYIKDNGEGKSIYVSSAGKYNISCSTSGEVLIHKVIFNCVLQVNQLYFNNITYTFNNVAGTIEFLFLKGVVGNYNSIYWKSENCTSSDTDTNNYKIIPNSNNVNPVYDGIILTATIADNQINLIEHGYSNQSGTMIEVSKNVKCINMPSIFIQPQLYLVEGETFNYDTYNRRINGINVEPNTNIWVVYDKNYGTGYTLQSTATLQDGFAMVGYIRIKGSGHVEDISQFYSQESFKGATTKTMKFVCEVHTLSESGTYHAEVKYCTLTIDSGGRVTGVVIDTDWTRIL